MRRGHKRKFKKDINKELLLFLFILICIIIILLTRTEVKKQEPINPKSYLSYEEVNGLDEKNILNITKPEERHWNHMPLTYQIYDCPLHQYNRIVKAFNQIENETDNVISFVYMNETDTSFYVDADNGVHINPINETDINVYCYKEEYGVLHFWYPGKRRGIGRVGYEVDKIYPNIMSKGIIEFYSITSDTYSGGCSVYPDIEIILILELFNFKTNQNKSSIMNEPYTKCHFKIDSDIIDKLKEMYAK